MGNKIETVLPNLLTFVRIVGACSLLFFDIQTKPNNLFWWVYAFCGLTDMADGFFARRFQTTTKSGALFDSLADLTFLACCAYKLLPVLVLPLEIWIWIGGIATIKVANQITAWKIHRKFVFPHTVSNKMTGILLFAFLPFIVNFELQYCLPITLATIATFTALQERKYIKINTV